jgi:hypothetical protein
MAMVLIAEAAELAADFQWVTQKQLRGVGLKNATTLNYHLEKPVVPKHPNKPSMPCGATGCELEHSAYKDTVTDSVI